MAERERRFIELNELPAAVWGDYARMKRLTCRNHPDAEYLTKNPWTRSLAITALPKGLRPEERTATGECRCPFRDLVVVEVDGERAAGMGRNGGGEQ